MRTGFLILFVAATAACGSISSGDDAGGDDDDDDAGANGADAGPVFDASPPDADVPPGCGDGSVDAPEACDKAIDPCCNETCTGPATVDHVCRPVAGACDIPETCDGASFDCPVDQLASAVVVCRPSEGLCDPVERCTGDSPTCPDDELDPPSTVCRPGTDDCDATERCTGGSAACPSDESEPDGTSCDDCPDGPGACDECVAGMCTNSCGNGDLDFGEECDDGPLNSDTVPDACRTNCVLPFCGDNVTDTGEECDDGVLNSDTVPDACRTKCELPSCGDGVTDTGEECDGGFHCLMPACDLAEDLDVMLLVDQSGSFGAVTAELASQLPALHATLDASYPGVRIGVASFIDKPVTPFGADTDYLYQTDLQPTADPTAVVAALNALVLGFGGDGPEAQVEATMQCALRQTEVGWDPDRWRVIVLITDVGFHVAGDHGMAPANNLDIILDGTPPGTGEDYPRNDQVGIILARERVLPAYVTSSALASYDGLVASWGFGATASMTVGGADASTAIIAVITALEP